MTIHHPAWMQTIGAGAFDLMNPTADMINWHVVARILARIVRFGAHVDGERGLPVGQHLVEGAYAIMRDHGRRDWAAAYFLHDWHEFVIGDIASPVQCAIEAHAVQISGDINAGDLVKRSFKAAKRTLDAVIYPTAGLPWPLPPATAAIVAEYDIRMCRTERDRFMIKPPQEWVPIIERAVPVAGVYTHGAWSAERTEAVFKRTCLDFLPAYGGSC